MRNRIGKLGSFVDRKLSKATKYVSEQVESDLNFDEKIKKESEKRNFSLEELAKKDELIGKGIAWAYTDKEEKDLALIQLKQSLKFDLSLEEIGYLIGNRRMYARGCDNYSDGVQFEEIPKTLREHNAVKRGYHSKLEEKQLEKDKKVKSKVR